MRVSLGIAPDMVRGVLSFHSPALYSHAGHLLVGLDGCGWVWLGVVGCRGKCGAVV
jgi:hypothetical protein